MTADDPTPTPSMNVLHLNGHFQSLGGVEAVLKTHAKWDHAFGLNSRFVVTHERPSSDFPNVEFLGLSGSSNIRTARSRFLRAIAKMPEACVIYHNNWILPWLADLDRATRRILVLHSDYPDLARHLRSRVPYYDGIVTVSADLLEKVRKTGIDSNRVEFLHYPISPPPDLHFVQRESETHLRVGYCGRIEVNQKRLDRLAKLIDQLRARKVPFRFQLLGTGPDEPSLKERFRNFEEVQFLGVRTGDDYWRTLAHWDCIMFFSDFEGTPIALLEGMAAGAIPVFPHIQSGGDRVVGSISADLLYDSGRLDQAAAILQKIHRQSDTENLRLREKARLKIEPNLDHRYLQGFSEFVRRICSMPPCRHSPGPARFFPLDLVPFRALGWGNWLRRLARNF